MEDTTLQEIKSFVAIVQGSTTTGNWGKLKELSLSIFILHKSEDFGFIKLRITPLLVTSPYYGVEFVIRLSYDKFWWKCEFLKNALGLVQDTTMIGFSQLEKPDCYLLHLNQLLNGTCNAQQNLISPWGWYLEYLNVLKYTELSPRSDIQHILKLKAKEHKHTLTEQFSQEVSQLETFVQNKIPQYVPSVSKEIVKQFQQSNLNKLKEIVTYAEPIFPTTSTFFWMIQNISRDSMKDILVFLTASELGNARMVCKKWKEDIDGWMVNQSFFFQIARNSVRLVTTKRQFVGKLRNECLLQLSNMASTFDIELKTLVGSTHSIPGINSKMTVTELKKKIHEITGSDPETQRLLYGGKHMEDWQHLYELEIFGPCTVHLVFRLLAG